jgi:hypothetical protein
VPIGQDFDVTSRGRARRSAAVVWSGAKLLRFPEVQAGDACAGEAGEQVTFDAGHVEAETRSAQGTTVISTEVAPVPSVRFVERPIHADELIVPLVLVSVFVIGPLLAILYALVERSARERERRLAGLLMSMQMHREQNASVDAERERVMFQLHRDLNERQLLKLDAELVLMQGQQKLMEGELRRRDEAAEFHAAMMEKTRLEVESLKLHIREQRKRLDDYGQYDD